jgi:rhodanese-related sulfurtransferase
MKDIHPKAFVDLLEEGIRENSLVLDVRETYEWEYYHLDDTVLMPMNTIPTKLSELPEDKDIYVICAHGVRSQMVCGYLQERGFERVINVQGGMAAVSWILGFQYD